MDYKQEAQNGRRICLDELWISDMKPVMQALHDPNVDIIDVLCDMYYAGYSVGYRDGQGVADADRKADQDGSEPLDISPSGD